MNATAGQMNHIFEGVKSTGNYKKRVILGLLVAWAFCDLLAIEEEKRGVGAIYASDMGPLSRRSNRRCAKVANQVLSTDMSVTQSKPDSLMSGG